MNTMLEPIFYVESDVVFFNNFFHEPPFSARLGRENFSCMRCGTLRDERTSRYPLEQVNSIEKKERGTYYHKPDWTLLYVKWNDNKAVTEAISYYDVNPQQKVERWINESDKKSISQPHPIKMYNYGVGVVDTCDHLLSSYRPIYFRSKKGWWNFFTRTLNLYFVASFKCYSLANAEQKLSHVQFRREVTRTLLARQTDRTRI